MAFLTYGRDRLGDPATASKLEWLATNGIGGFAAGTASGVLTRRYHGLLVAALIPPVGRTVLLSKLSESLERDGDLVELDTNHRAGGGLEPRGHVHLERFRLEGTIPAWTWAIGDTRLEKRVWMEHGENTTWIEYRLSAAPRPATLRLEALANHRDAHHVTLRGEWEARVEPVPQGVRIRMFEAAAPLWLFAPGARVEPCHEWRRGFGLALERERGLEDLEDHLHAATITARLEPGQSLMVAASTQPEALARVEGARGRRHAHEQRLLAAWRAGQPRRSRQAPEWIGQLVLAADAFVIGRRIQGGMGRSVIAGYPWFTDWGRDTMISLQGLSHAVGRPELASRVLETFARYVDRGMLPNYFPDEGEPPEYNTVDAALWFFQAVRRDLEAEGDEARARALWPKLVEIVDHYERGTRFGIAMDPADGLVRAGEPGQQLTWMDAKVDGIVFTPREGKPVEINALWYNALAFMATLAVRLGEDPARYAGRAEQVRRSFARFWNEARGCLFDVLDGPEGHEALIRPNQLFALSLPECPLEPARARAVLDVCGRTLLTSHGLRSLAPGEPGYVPRYFGDRRSRDGAYHQGTVWMWLLPHWALAHFRVHRDRDAALAFLAPFGQLIGEMGVGTLPEVADAEPPFVPRGCFAQAWSVAETLRVWHELMAQRPKRVPSTRTRGRTPAPGAAGAPRGIAPEAQPIGAGAGPPGATRHA